MLVCKELGVSEENFLDKISTFKGSKRLELVKKRYSSNL